VAEDQVTTFAERVMEHLQDLAVESRARTPVRGLIGHEIELRNWRVAEQVVFGESDRLAKPRADAIVSSVALEEAIEQAFRYVVAERDGVAARARLHERAPIAIRCEDLELELDTLDLHCLEERQGERVRFLSRGAVRHPRSDRRMAIVRLHELTAHAVRENFEHVSRGTACVRDWMAPPRRFGHGRIPLFIQITRRQCWDNARGSAKCRPVCQWTV
jgi:hypothetical protein